MLRRIVLRRIEGTNEQTMHNALPVDKMMHHGVASRYATANCTTVMHNSCAYLRVLAMMALVRVSLAMPSANQTIL